VRKIITTPLPILKLQINQVTLLSICRVVEFQIGASHIKDKGPRGILKDHLVAFQMIVDTLKGMRDSGQPLDSTITQTVIQGIISAVAPKLFERRTKSGFFNVSRRFARKFVRRHMGWT